MCGISVVLRAGSSALPPGPVLQRMHQEIAHRGPDGEGVLTLDAALQPRCVRAERLDRLPVDENIQAAGAFRWLRIQDLDPRSAQPMASADSRLWILFNGEIYNHRELRAELAALGERFATESDTEVALAAYRRWGTGAFARFHGMWAIALFDLERRELVLSRDRLGIKPLYYAIESGWLLLSSEPKAIALASPSGPRAEPFRLHEFLRGLPPQSAELSFFAGVHPFPAGCFARVPLQGDGRPEPRPEQYWSLADFPPDDGLPEARFGEMRERFEALLLEAVASHAQAAVPLGALLSGGLDSSILARLLADDAMRRGDAPPAAFSMIYADPAMSEWPYMQLVIAQGGLRGFNRVLDADRAWASTADVVAAQGQPLLGQDSIAQFHAYQLAREHGATVVIEGQGADELFAGLPGYDAQQFPSWLVQGRWLRLGRELADRRRRMQLGWRRAAATFVLAPLQRQWSEARGLPRFDWLVDDRVDSSRPGPGRRLDGGPGRSRLQRFLYRHVRHTNLPAVLMHQDRSSMANRIESRVPFLDHRLVEFAMQLPDGFKVCRGVRKRILLETARRHLPAAVVERRDKRSLVSRLGWMELRARRAAELREMAASRELAEFGLLRPAALRRFVEDFLQGRHGDEMAIWRLCTLRHWLATFRARL
jgi:asparagine synthase (glutamine-hydrolysing)